MRVPHQVEGVFIGAGHNALVAANYLARAGVRCLVLEEQPRIGGGLFTAEVTLPLFQHNLCAVFSGWTPRHRVWRDLQLDRYGLRCVVPEVQSALPLSDGGGLVLYNDIGRSAQAIHAFSNRDAATYARVYPELANLVSRVAEPLRLSAPLPPDELAARLGRSDLGTRYLALARSSPLDVVREMFESEVVRTLVLFNVATRAHLPLLDVPGTGHVVAQALIASHRSALTVGGTEKAARALTACLYDHGGLVMTSARVERILVESGRAAGVELHDGRRFEARRFVCSSLPAALTFGRLVEPQHLGGELRQAFLDYHWHEDCLLGVHLALRQVPQYRICPPGADLQRALSYCIGYETSGDLERDMERIRARRMPDRAAFQAAVPTLFDPTQAPPGHSTAFAWQFIPRPPATVGEDEGAVFKQLAERMLRRWGDYAPNLPEARLAMAIHTPRDTEQAVSSMVLGDRHHGSYHPDNTGWNRPHPALSAYRTPIAGLYHCGSATHPGGGLSGHSGFNAATAIAEDFGYPAWWKPKSARMALAEL